VNELEEAVRQAITDVTNPEDLLTVQARAAVEAMTRLGYVQAHGWEFAVKRGDVLMAQSFNTREQADAELERWPAGEFQIVRRPVGVWEPAE
jgi:hypothetical protein